LNDHANEGDFIWESTGERVGPYTNWDEGEPKDGISNSCVYLNDGEKWRTADCLDSFHVFICEAPLGFAIIAENRQ